MYAAENKGHYCAASPDINDAGGGRIRWHGERATADGTTSFDPKKGLLAEYMPDAQVKECPVFTEFKRLGEVADAFESGTGGYGYNEQYVGGTSYLNDYLTAPKVTTLDSRISNPSGTIMFSDAALASNGHVIEYGFVEPPYFPSPDKPTGNVDWGLAAPSMHFRHNGRVNVVWCDGHVTSEKWEWGPESNYYGGNNRAAALGWFGPKNNSNFDVGPKDQYTSN
jgi:prepilin-type processing-associated H-X9-DG protein